MGEKMKPTEELVHHFEAFTNCFFHDEKTGEMRSLCPTCMSIRSLIVAFEEWQERADSALVEYWGTTNAGYSIRGLIDLADKIRDFGKGKK